MAEFSIDLGPIGDEFSAIIDRVDAKARSAMDLGLDSIVETARALAPAGSTGVLKKSIRSGGAAGTLSGGGMSGEIIADAPHAAAHEYGSGLYGEKGAKYPIRPKNKKALRWAVQGFIGPVAPMIQGVKGTAAAASSSGFAFSRGVMHPGVKGQHFIERAVETEIDNIEAQVAAAIEFALIKR